MYSSRSPHGGEMDSLRQKGTGKHLAGVLAASPDAEGTWGEPTGDPPQNGASGSSLVSRGCQATSAIAAASQFLQDLTAYRERSCRAQPAVPHVYGRSNHWTQQTPVPAAHDGGGRVPLGQPALQNLRRYIQSSVDSRQLLGPGHDLPSPLGNDSGSLLSGVGSGSDKAVEKILFGETSSWCISYTREVCEQARMLVYNGWSPRTKLLPFGVKSHDKEMDEEFSVRIDDYFFNRGRAHRDKHWSQKWVEPERIRPARHSVEISGLFQQEIDRAVFEAEQMAEEGILANMRSLYDITEKLLKDQFMTGADIIEILEHNKAQMFPDLGGSPDYKDLADPTLLDPLTDPEKAGLYYPLCIYPAPLHRCPQDIDDLPETPEHLRPNPAEEKAREILGEPIYSPPRRAW